MPPERGAPAPKSTRSPSTAGHAFTPARIRVRQTSSPSAAANAYTVPSKVDVKTTSFETVAQPKLGEGSRRSQSARPVRGVEGDEAALSPRGHDGRQLLVARGAPPPAQVDDRDEQAALGVGHRRQDPAEQAGADDHSPRRQRAAVVAVETDRRGPAPPARLAVPGDHTPRLAGSEDELLALDRRQDRRRLEVVVADVVRCHLVVPEQAAAPRVEHEQRVRVRHRAWESGAVGVLRRSAPRLRVRVPRVEPALRVDRDRIPEPTSAGLERIPPRFPDRDELPAHHSGRGVERVDRAPSARREADGTGEDEPPPDDGRDVDELLRRAGQVPAPQLPARLRRRGRTRRSRSRRRPAGRPRRARSAPRSARGSGAPSAASRWRARERARCSGGPGCRPSRGRRRASTRTCPSSSASP